MDDLKLRCRRETIDRQVNPFFAELRPVDYTPEEVAARLATLTAAAEVRAEIARASAPAGLLRRRLGRPILHHQSQGRGA